MPVHPKTPRRTRNSSPRSTPEPAAVAVSILAGGLSTRMGRDKSKVLLRRRTLLGHAKAAAKGLGLTIRVIRKDSIAQCGPLGGVHTALRSSRAAAELFLACDMPFVSPDVLNRLIRALRETDLACFIVTQGLAGFPFVIRSRAAEVVKAEILKGRLSLQQLAATLKARRLHLEKAQRAVTFNINTPGDLETARARVKKETENLRTTRPLSRSCRKAMVQP